MLDGYYSHFSSGSQDRTGYKNSVNGSLTRYIGRCGVAKRISRVSANLLKSLKKSTSEKDVENAYRKAFETIYPGSISSPFKTDGILETKEISILLEFKFGWKLTEPLEQAKAIIQAVWYLKQIMDSGKQLPKAVFIGDENECFCVPTHKLSKYLAEKVDWTIAPSKAYSCHQELLIKISSDAEVYPFTYKVIDTLDFLSVIERVRKINLDQPVEIAVTKHNLCAVYNSFVNALFHGQKTIDENEMVDTFITCLIAPNDAYLHPNKPNTMVCDKREYKVKEKSFRSFFETYRKKHTASEIQEITATKDRIIENLYRRRTGAFFTPDIWVAEAHKMISDVFGPNWKEEFVVWDCACGTANLTRDYKFKELYLSTLEKDDVQIIKKCAYNPEAAVFQYDFLSELELGSKIPTGLKKAFEDKRPVLIFINPPYGTAQTGDDRNGKSKPGIAKTWMNKEMKRSKVGGCRNQLYAQFLYRISQLKNRFGNRVSLGTFSPPLFVTGPSFKKFRPIYFSPMKFRSGMLFPASEFADVKGNWGISFTIWNSQGNNNDVVLHIKEINPDSCAIETNDKKTLYAPVVGGEASSWAKKGLAGKSEDVPQMSSSIGIKAKGHSRMIPGSLGYMNNNSNNVYKNLTCVGLYSSAYSACGGFSIQPTNFMRAIALFTARKTIQPDWVNCKDEYLVPNTEHPDYKQWNNDALVYALFNTSSNQSSLRDVDYKGKKWDIPNKFFFMANAEMMDLADKASFMEMYQDTKRFPEEAYVYNLLGSTQLSSDAQAVLDAARDLIRKTMSMRALYNESHPEYCLQSWDAGWAQLKPLMKEHFKDELKNFTILYKAFEDRMRLGVEKFGWLKS